MFKIYGGLLLESLISMDQFFNLQMSLFQKGLINGVQLRVAHPSFTPKVNLGDVTNIINSLPTDFGVFIHCGSENVGVDLGENFDEKRVYTQFAMNYKVLWEEWNRRTVQWSLDIARAVKDRIIENDVLAVIHPGYGKISKDITALKKIVKSLKLYDPEELIALENTPRIISRDLQEKYSPRPINWMREKYWSFGGTPENMRMLLNALGGKRKCFLDFTHLIVTSNLAKASRSPEFLEAHDLEKTVADYMSLPHSKVCHFAGVPDIPVDIHTYFKVPIVSPVKDALKDMRVVCLEFPWNPKNGNSERYIETFMNNFK